MQKKIARREITICQTDKSAGIAITSREVWEELGKIHTDGDMVIDWEEVKEDQRIIKGHMRCLNHIFCPGSNSSSEERVWAAKELMSSVIPLMYPLIKDHKPVGADGKPASRPVCSASRSINGEISDTVSQILESVSNALESSEVISGEELRARIDDEVEELKDKEMPEFGYCVGSLDVKAQYPSLEIYKLCKDLF